MELIVDIQGFKGNDGNFIFKEIAYIDPNALNPVPYVATFQPPCDWSDLDQDVKILNRFLQSNLHGIHWEHGEVPYSYLSTAFDKLKEKVEGSSLTIWVKGEHKKYWLQPYFDNIRNLEDLGCPSIRTPGFIRPLACINHRPGWKQNCSVEIVCALYRWVEELREQYSTTESSDTSE